MLFSQEAWAGLADGSITVTFRTWKRPQAKVGSVHRVADTIRLVVDAVASVPVASLTAADAAAAGSDLPSLLQRLDTDGDVWRVDFHVASDPDPRAALRAASDLSPEDLADLDRRLARLERNGPWTLATLAVIDELPATVSSVLAERLSRDRAELKLDVRKLKGLGLTESLGTGYQLSPRGRAYLAARR